MRPSCTAVASMVLFTGVKGFLGSGLLPRKAGLRTAADPCTARCSAQDAPTMTTPGGSSRGDFLKSVAEGGALGLAAVLSPALSKSAVAAAQTLEDLEADIMLCKEIFKPTLQYLKAEQFDAARTNTNYISRVINIKKKIDSLIVQANDVVDDVDTLEKAFDMAQEVDALFTNFDASVYTIIFIPTDADGVLPPGAEKYLKQAYGFYDDINKVLDFYIGLVPSETKAAAEKLVPAKRAPLPKFLFKEDAAIMREKVAIS